MPVKSDPTPSRITELDGIRGTAILLILYFHWIVMEGGDGFLPVILQNLGKLAWSGVDLFFVLSGFLISSSLMDARSTRNYFKVFYIRRCCRIVPLYLVILIFSVIVYHSSLPQPTHKWLFGSVLPWQSYLFFMQNFVMAMKNSMGSKMIDATWSLAVEEQFYLMLPFIIRSVRVKRLPWVFLAGIILAPIIRISLSTILGAERSSIGNYVLLFCRMDSLCIGAFGAWILRYPQNRSSLFNSHPYLLYVISGVLFAGVCGIANMKLPFDSIILMSIGYSWIAFFYFSILWIALTRRHSLIAKILRLRILTFFGTLAYGLYLLHQPILGIVHGIIRNTSPLITERSAYYVTILSFGCLLLLTYVSWNYFEKPLVKLGHKYKYQ